MVTGCIVKRSPSASEFGAKATFSFLFTLRPILSMPPFSMRSGRYKRNSVQYYVPDMKQHRISFVKQNTSHWFRWVALNLYLKISKQVENR